MTMYLQGVDLSDLFRPSGSDITQKTSGTKLKILGADADILTLGDATHEGGDLKIYRNGSGDLQLSLDADAASNTKALDVYGGVVAQNYLTVGQVALDASYPLSVHGNVSVTSNVYAGAIYARYTNSSQFLIGLPVAGTDSTDHNLRIRIGLDDIICIKATGDGAGGITNKSLGLYGTTPATQAAAIADPAESTAGNNAAIDSILAALRAIGLIAT